MQMFADFFQSHLPAASPAEVGRARSISYLANIPFISISSRLLNDAIDALCFAHLGTARKDQAILNESRERYTSVLATIRHFLSHSSLHSRGGRDLLMSIMIISLFDECMPVEHRGLNSAMTHLWGAQLYLTASSPAQFDLSQPLDRCLILSVFQNAFWLGLARRKPLGKDHPAWPPVQSAIFPGRTPYTILRQLPGLLERTDSFLNESDRADLATLSALFQELDDVRFQILTLSQEELTAAQSRVIQLTEYEEFDMNIEEHYFITHAEPTFHSFFRFSGPESAVNHACRAIIFLLIDCTLLRLYHFVPDACRLPSRRTPDKVGLDAFDWASQLCRCVYLFSTFRSLAYIDFIIILLEFAQNFFQEQSAWQEMGWCQACLVVTRRRLERLREVRPPTLCRVGYLPAGISGAGRYRDLYLDRSEINETVNLPSHCPMAYKVVDLPYRATCLTTNLTIQPGSSRSYIVEVDSDA